MFDYRIKEDGDISLEVKDFQFTETIQESLINRLKIRFGVWQGEWAFNESFGTPYRQRLLGSSLTREQKDAEITRVCYEDPDVLRVIKINSTEDPYARTYNVHEVIVETTNGKEAVPLAYTQADPYTYPEPSDQADIILCRSGQMDFEAINRLYILMNNKLPVTGEYTWWTNSWR